MFHLAMQHGGLWVGNGMMPANSKAATRNDVNWIGLLSGAMSQSPSDASRRIIHERGLTGREQLKSIDQKL